MMAPKYVALWTISALAAPAHAFVAPPALVALPALVATPSLIAGLRVGRAAADVLMSSDWPFDELAFLNSPYEYIEQNEIPDSEIAKGLKFLKSYEAKKKDAASNLWGDLPATLQLTGMNSKMLEVKSTRADELASIIAGADSETLKTLTEDATFEEKRALLQALAALPEESKGLLGIHEVVTSMRAAGGLPLMDQFEGDLERVTASVAAAKDALESFEAAYSTLFLSVRKVSMLASAAAEAKAEVGGGGGGAAAYTQEGYAQPQGYAQELPPGWSTGVDEASGSTYYFNEQTGESSWEPPTPS